MPVQGLACVLLWTCSTSLTGSTAWHGLVLGGLMVGLGALSWAASAPRDALPLRTLQLVVLAFCCMGTLELIQQVRGCTHECVHACVYVCTCRCCLWFEYCTAGLTST